MGVNFNLYLGIYIECENVYEKVKYIKQICSKCKKEYGEYEEWEFNQYIIKINFCEICGDKIIKEEIIKNIKKKFFEELEEELEYGIMEVDNRMCNTEKDIYIINGDSEFSLFFDEENNYIDLNDYPYKPLIDSFILKRQDVINFFNKYYKDKYKIKYGIVTYYS